MKKLKNNKGITGIDIVVSITIIVIVLGISLTVYSSYSEKSKEVKRTSVATNLAMKVIEKIEEKPIDSIELKPDTTDEINISTGYDVDTVPSGYEIKAIKKEVESDPIINSLAFQVDVIVIYSVDGEPKSVTLSTIKKKNETKEAEEPNIKGNEITINEGTEEEAKVEVIPVKYDVAKNGYVKTNSRDSEWYSISSKVFPIVIQASESDFDRNGVLNLTEKEDEDTYKFSGKVYIWQPSYYEINDNTVGFVDKETKKKIIYRTIENIGNYILGEKVENSKLKDEWVIVADNNLDNPNEQIEYYNYLFTWE